MGTAAWILLVLAEAFPSTCTVVGGNTITAGDISAAVPLFAAIPAATVLSLAPQPGIRRTLTPRELNAWARRFLPGSPGVDVLTSPCIVARTRVIERSEVERALRRAFGPGERNLQIELAGYSEAPVGAGELRFDAVQFPRASDHSAFVVWKGTAGDRQHVWARVRVRERYSEAFAARDLRRGEALRDGDIEWREVWRTPPLPAQVPRELPAKATWLRSLHRGDAVRSTDLRLPQLVRGGDHVELELASGPLSIRVRTIARTSGQTGQRVLLSSPLSKRSIQGVVKEDGHVVAIAQ